MSYSDYWDGDPEMAVHYREKNRRDMERRNTELWLQGEYIYEAILYASPVYNVFAKHPKPLPYREEPIPLTKSDREDKEERDNKRKMAAGKEIMMGLMGSINARFKKEQAKDGSND